MGIESFTCSATQMLNGCCILNVVVGDSLTAPYYTFLSPEIEGGKGAVGITARSTPSGSRVSRFPHRFVTFCRDPCVVQGEERFSNSCPRSAFDLRLLHGQPLSLLCSGKQGQSCALITACWS